MNTLYKSLADRFFNKIKDYDIVCINTDEAYEIAFSYITPACADFRGCKQNLNNRDDLLEQFNFKLSDENIDILVNYMVLEWLESNYILTGSALKSRLTSSAFRSLNTYQQLGKLMELRDSLKLDNDRKAISKSYENSELFNIAVGKRRVRQ